MLTLVLPQIVALDRIRQRDRLTKSQTKPLACNCVDRSGSIPDQCNSIAVDALQPARRCNRAPLAGDDCARLEAFRKQWKT
jgi:hypothetical protein